MSDDLHTNTSTTCSNCPGKAEFTISRLLDSGELIFFVRVCRNCLYNLEKILKERASK